MAIWFAHSFANVVAGGRDATWRAALVHEEPVMLGAVPVIVAALLGQLFGWSSAAVELAGLIGLGVLLIAIQLVLLRTAPPHERRVGGTLVLDLVSALLIVLLLLAVHWRVLKYGHRGAGHTKNYFRPPAPSTRTSEPS